MKSILMTTIVLALLNPWVCPAEEEKPPIPVEEIRDLLFKSSEVAPETEVEEEPVPEVVEPLITLESLNRKVLILNSQFNRIVKQLEALERAREQIRGQVMLIEELRKVLSEGEK